MNNVIMITGDDFKDVYIWDINTEPGIVALKFCKRY